MKRKLILSLLLLVCLCAASVAEEMPAVVDEPLAQQEIDQPDALRQAQLWLIDLGLLKGSADGKYGRQTAAALVAFQSQNGLAPTGRLDAETLRQLEAAASKVRSPREVQQRLIDLGYLGGKADGKFGKQSAAALALFQRVHGLEATGAQDEVTLDKLFSGDVVALPAGLSGGDSGEAVARLQQRLAALGFYSGEADGAYGKSTTAAVKRFQEHLIAQGYRETYPIAANGEAAPIVQFFLFGDGYSSYLRDIVAGEPDSEAERVERRLSQLGYMDMPADDVLDDYGLTALGLFRADAGLPETGAVDRAVIDALFAGDAPRAEHYAPHDVKLGDAGRAVRDVEEALVVGGMMTKIPDGKYNKDVKEAIKRLNKYLKRRKDARAELFADPETLSVEAQQAFGDGLLGYVSDVGRKKNTTEALRVQRRLYSLCYLAKSAVDGKTGKKSLGAIKAFQAENGLEQTGIADEITQERLFSRDALQKPYPYRVEVSIERQKVEVYRLKEDHSYERVKSFDCSTGKHNSTPRGIFLDARPLNRWHYFKKFKCWAQYSFRIQGDILFHSVIYSAKNEKTLHRSSLRAIGDPASHGCVRLLVDDAKWLFEHCERGSLVVVVY